MAVDPRRRPIPTQVATPPPTVAPGGINLAGISAKNQGSVNSAYQQMMAYYNQSDADKGDLTRRLSTNLDVGQKNRDSSLLNSRQGFSDNGLLNSGIALKRMEDLNTTADTLAGQETANYDTTLAGIARRRLDLGQGYEDARVQGTALTASDEATQAAADLLARQQAEQNAADQAALMAQIGLTTPPPPEQIAQPEPQQLPQQVYQQQPQQQNFGGQSYAEAAQAYLAAMARNAQKAAPKVQATSKFKSRVV